MSDLLAKCDWLNGDVLVLTLPQDPSSIHVKLFDSKHAPSKVYVPESYLKQWELGADYLRLGKENAKLRERVHELEIEYDGATTAVLEKTERIEWLAGRLRGETNENDRLRELVRDMMRFFEDGDYCTICEKVAECESLEEYESDCLMRGVFKRRIAELGVEVDK